MPNFFQSLLRNGKLSDFSGITHTLKHSLRDESIAQEEIQKAINVFYEALPKASHADIVTANDSLSELFFLKEEARCTAAMMICGNLLEKGYHSTLATDRIIEKMTYLTESAYPFYQAFKAHLSAHQSLEQDEEFDEFELLDSLKDSLWDDLSDAIISWNVLEEQYIPAVSAFSLNGDARKLAKAAIKYVEDYAEYNTGCLWLNKLFQVLFNESILVIEPDTQLGFVGKISGIEDNFQLHGLLMDAFPAKSKGQARITPTQANVFKGVGAQTQDGSVIGTWNMSDWRAAKDNLAVSMKKSDFWIWHEGIPADIPKWKEWRVILLSKPSYSRGMSLQRTFSHLKASIQIEKELTPVQVVDYLAQMADVTDKI